MVSQPVTRLPIPKPSQTKPNQATDQQLPFVAVAHCWFPVASCKLLLASPPLGRQIKLSKLFHVQCAIWQTICDIWMAVQWQLWLPFSQVLRSFALPSLCYWFPSSLRRHRSQDSIWDWDWVGSPGRGSVGNEISAIKLRVSGTGKYTASRTTAIAPTPTGVAECQRLTMWHNSHSPDIEAAWRGCLWSRCLAPSMCNVSRGQHAQQTRFHAQTLSQAKQSSSFKISRSHSLADHQLCMPKQNTEDFVQRCSNYHKKMNINVGVRYTCNLKD